MSGERERGKLCRGSVGLGICQDGQHRRATAFLAGGRRGRVPAETELHRGFTKWGLPSDFQLAQLLRLHLQLEHL